MKDIKELTLEDCKTLKNNSNLGEIVNPLSGKVIKTDGLTYSKLIKDRNLMDICSQLESEASYKPKGYRKKQVKNEKTGVEKKTEKELQREKEKEKEMAERKEIELQHFLDKIAPLDIIEKIYSNVQNDYVRSRLDFLHYKYFEKEPYISVRQFSGKLDDRIVSLTQKEVQSPLNKQNLPIVEIVADADGETTIHYFMKREIFIDSKDRKKKGTTSPFLREKPSFTAFTLYFNHKTNKIRYVRIGREYRTTPTFKNDWVTRRRSLIALLSLGLEGTTYNKHLEDILMLGLRKQQSTNRKITYCEYTKGFVYTNEKYQVLSHDDVLKIKRALNRITNDILNDKTQTWDLERQGRGDNLGELLDPVPVNQNEQALFKDSVDHFIGVIGVTKHKPNFHALK